MTKMFLIKSCFTFLICFDLQFEGKGAWAIYDSFSPEIFWLIDYYSTYEYKKKTVFKGFVIKLNSNNMGCT